MCKDVPHKCWKKSHKEKYRTQQDHNKRPELTNNSRLVYFFSEKNAVMQNVGENFKALPVNPEDGDQPYFDESDEHFTSDTESLRLRQKRNRLKRMKYTIVKDMPITAPITVKGKSKIATNQPFQV